MIWHPVSRGVEPRPAECLRGLDARAASPVLGHDQAQAPPEWAVSRFAIW